LKISEPYPGVLHLEFATRKDLTLTMARVQEFYESPYPHIKGRYFTWAQFVDAYSDDKGNLTYFQEWEGFNVPRAILTTFYQIFTDLSPREEWLRTVSDECEYLIGTDKDSDPSAVLHELAHAKYKLNPEYRKQVRAITDKMTQDLGFRFQRDLRAADYPDDVEILRDEVHAYLKTSTEEELVETFPSVSPEERAPYEAALRLL
jgi:hypothetical protein